MIYSRTRFSLLIAVLLFFAFPVFAKEKQATNTADDQMSAMGRIAAKVRAALEERGLTLNQAVTVAVPKVLSKDDEDNCINTPEDCEGGFSEGPAGGQAETSIAVDSTGTHIVVGFNDTRGFALNPLSVSGFMYSDDGGATSLTGANYHRRATTLSAQPGYRRFLAIRK